MIPCLQTVPAVVMARKKHQQQQTKLVIKTVSYASNDLQGLLDRDRKITEAAPVRDDDERVFARCKES